MRLFFPFPSTIKKQNKTKFASSPETKSLSSPAFKEHNDLKIFRRAVIWNQSQPLSRYQNPKILSKGKQRRLNLKNSKNRETGCCLLIAKGSKVHRTSVILVEIFAVKRRPSCQTTCFLVVLLGRCYM